jgi:hypothetical protein
MRVKRVEKKNRGRRQNATQKKDMLLLLCAEARQPK